MTYAAYALIPNSLCVQELLERVTSLFPSKENLAYFSNITSRKNEESIKESLSSLILLGMLVQKAGADEAKLVLKRSENGKPLFEFTELFFSLSHSKGYVCAVLTDTGRVGIDIECADISYERAQRLSARFFSDAELSGLKAAPDKFKWIWTKKESRAKMRGIPLAELISEEKKTTSEQNAHGKEFYLHFNADDNPLTVCLEVPDSAVFFQKMEL